MAGDMAVAVGRTTADGSTLFAQNSHRGPRDSQVLRLQIGLEHAQGEKVRTQHLELAQARQTFTVLGTQPSGRWGYTHGINEHGLAIGACDLHTRLRQPSAGLLGTDLVRLALERSRSALQAVDLALELLERHGAGSGGAEPDGDASLLIASASEAFLIEGAGRHWVLQELHAVRAVSDVCTVQQDWVRISRGLASQAIEQGWWPADGSKLDFAAAVGHEPPREASALRRLGRATLLLEQQSGHIDVPFLRRLLADHYLGLPEEVDPLGEGGGPAPLCQHGANGRATVSSMVAALPADPAKLPLAWCAFGPPCVAVYFPVFLTGELPDAFTLSASVPIGDSIWWRSYRLHEQLRADPERVPEVCAAFDRLQARFDQEAEEFAPRAADMQAHGATAELQRDTREFLLGTVREFWETLNEVHRHEHRTHGAAVAVGPASR